VPSKLGYLVRPWSGSAALWAVGLALIVRWAPHSTGGEPVPQPVQTLRVHLPWIGLCALSTAAAGTLYRDPATLPQWLSATLPIPVVAVLVGATSGMLPASSSAITLLYLGEAVFGIVLGLFIGSLFREVEPDEGYR